MPAFELAAAELASATGTTSARPAARTAPPIHVFMRTMSSCEPCLHASAPPDGLISHARQARGLRACLKLTRTQAAGITSGASGDDDGDDNPSGANGGGASALGW